MRSIDDGCRAALDVYFTSFPVCTSLSVDRSKLCVWHYCSDVGIPRSSQLDELGGYKFNIIRMLFSRKMRKYITLSLVILSLSVHAEVEIALLKSAESQFKQIRTSAVLTDPLIQMGKFAYYAPDSIYWKYDGLDNVQLPEQMLSLIRQAVSGNMASVNGTFETTWHEQKLTLIPKKKQISKFFKQIDIYFNAAGVATTVILSEPSGDQTQIEFINMKYTTL